MRAGTKERRVVTAQPSESTSIEVGEQPMPDAADAQVYAYGDGIVVTLYGRPFRLSKSVALQLAWNLVRTLENGAGGTPG